MTDTKDTENTENTVKKKSTLVYGEIQSGKTRYILNKTKEAVKFYQWTLEVDPDYAAAQASLKRIKQ